MAGSVLSGRRIVITRAEPGELGDLLAAAGAEVIHLPLIAAMDPVDGGEAARAAVAGLQPGDWLVVTSPEGARRALAAGPIADTVRTAAVGDATARVLAEGLGRPVDLVPAVALGRELGRELGHELGRELGRELGANLDPTAAASGGMSCLLVLHGDLAAQDWVEDLRAGGHRVHTVVAYRTVAAPADPAAAAAARRADAVVFASGSAAQSWVGSIGTDAPAVVCSIGPSTTAVAESVGLRITHQAREASVAGVMDILRSAFRDASPTMG